jgi:hypothetical protein
VIKDILLGFAWFSFALVFNDRILLFFVEGKTVLFAWLLKSFFSAGISFLLVFYIKEIIIPRLFRVLLFLFAISCLDSFIFKNFIYHYVSEAEIIFEVFLWGSVIPIGALIGGWLGKIAVCAAQNSNS